MKKSVYPYLLTDLEYDRSWKSLLATNHMELSATQSHLVSAPLNAMLGLRCVKNIRRRSEMDTETPNQFLASLQPVNPHSLFVSFL